MTMLVCKPNGMRRYRGDLSQALDSFISAAGPDGRRAWAPAVDVKETEASFVVTAELPGLSKDAIKVEIENGRLSITGERQFERSEEKASYHFVERSYGSFRRSFALPRQVDSEAIEAEYKDGVLTLTLPKRETAKPKTVEVKA